MSLSREEILAYAGGYVEQSEITAFVMDGELFALIEREQPENGELKDDEGWKFAGYGICIGYELDPEARPAGKWIYFQFLSLSAFPPARQVLKLQPPHIVKGRFSSADRSHEIRILATAINVQDATQEVRTGRAKLPAAKAEKDAGKILQFPAKTKAKS